MQMAAMPAILSHCTPHGPAADGRIRVFRDDRAFARSARDSRVVVRAIDGGSAGAGALTAPHNSPATI
jgi:hypothetical protein